MKQLLGVSALAVSGLMVAFAVGWILLSAMNFSYGLWHDHGGIGDAIEQYGPLNRYKTGFAETSRAQRVDLFAQINHAINNNGEGLETISYKVDGHPEQTLLRAPEVVHLQDVANLVRTGMGFAIIMLFAWVCCWMVLLLKKSAAPPMWQQVVAIGAVLAVIGLVVAIMGPVDVFYWLHTVVFPDGHEWFFYYQDSLMSTMMYAPVLFGYIAVEWLLLSLMIFVGLQWLGSGLLNLYLMGR